MPCKTENKVLLCHNRLSATHEQNTMHHGNTKEHGFAKHLFTTLKPFDALNNTRALSVTGPTERMHTGYHA